MRQIGLFEETEKANRFADYLITLGIGAHAEEANGKWEVWVRDEDQLDKAKLELDSFLQNPNDSRFQNVQTTAQQIRNEQVKKREQAKRNTVDMRTHWNRPASRRAPLAFATIIVCIALFVLTSLGGQQGFVYRTLGVVDPFARTEKADIAQQIFQGQIWRIWTPNLLHGGIFHIGMNLFAFWHFASQIESLKKSRYLLLLMFLTGTGTSLIQLLMVRTTPFVGISGVVFGLFGFVWMKSRFEPSAGFFISDSTIMFLLAFFFICFTGAFGSAIANWGHTGGLLTGMAIGYWPTFRIKNLRT